MALIFITGNSHSAAMRKGLSLLEGDLHQLASTVRFEIFGLGSDFALDDGFFREAGKYLLLNSGHLHEARFTRLPPDPMPFACGFCLPQWHEFSWSASWKLEAGGSPINTPYAEISAVQMRKAFETKKRHSLRALVYLKEQRHNIFAIECPYPFKHRTDSDSWDLPTVLAADNFCRQLFRSICKESGMPLVRVPEHCLDGDGFMKPEYSAGKDDKFHGNAKFGETMLREILKMDCVIDGVRE